MNMENKSFSALTITDLMKITGWTRGYIYKLSSKGVLPVYKPLGKTIFFRKSEIEDFLLSNRNNSKKDLEGSAREFVNKKMAAI